MRNKHLEILIQFVLIATVFLSFVSFASALSITTYSPTADEFIANSLVTVELMVTASTGHTIYCDVNSDKTGVMNATVENTLVGNSVLTPISLGSFSDGSYQWNVNCTDITDSSTSLTALTSFIVDATNPVVTLTSPLDNYIITTGKATSLIGNVVDDNLDSCELYTNFSGTWTASSLTNQVALPNFLYNSPDLNDDLYQWNVYCDDSAGNSAIATDNFNFEIDFINDAPFFDVDDQSIPRGLPLSLSLNASDSNDHNVLSYTSNSSNYTINSATGMISNSDPQSSEIVNFTVCDNQGQLNSCYDDTIEFTVRASQTSANLTAHGFGADLERGENCTTTVYLENTGDFDIDNINFYTSFDLKYETVFTNVPTILSVGAKTPITLQIYLPFSHSSENTNLGSIFLQTGSTLLDELPVSINVKNELEIDDLTFNVIGGLIYDDLEYLSYPDDIKVSPGESVKLSLNIENSFSSSDDIRIKEIETTLTIDEFGSEDGDDFEYVFSTFSVDADESRDIYYTFKAPFVLEDDVEYDILLEIEGEDEHGKKHSFEWEGVILGQRTDNEIRIVSYEISTQKISCMKYDSPINFKAKIQNTGYKDQEFMFAEFYLPELKINDTYEFSLLSDPGDDDNWYEIDTTFYVDKDLAAGKYYVNLDVYSDFSHKEDKLVLSFVVESCPATTPTTPVVDEDDEEIEEPVVDEDDDEVEEPIDDSIIEVTPEDILRLRNIFADPDFTETNYDFSATREAKVSYQASSKKMKAVLANDEFDFNNETQEVFNWMISEIGNDSMMPILINKELIVYEIEDKETGEKLSKSEFIISFNITENIKEISIMEIIPKSIAGNALELYFVDNLPTILQDDPVVLWELKNLAANETHSISYFVDDEITRLSTQTINVAKTTPKDLFVIMDFLPIIGLIVGGLVVIFLIGFGTVYGLNKFFSNENLRVVQYEEQIEEPMQTYERRNPYFSGKVVEGYRKTKHISLPGLPPLEAEIDQENGKVKSILNM